MKELTAIDLNLEDIKTVQLDLEQKMKKKLNLNNYEKIIMNDIIKVENLESSFKDIVGLDSAKTTLQKFLIAPIKSETTKDFMPNGIIFHGYPGTGKTMLAKALATELDCPFINFSIASIENKMYGESGKILKALFTTADKIKPCVIFMDELDGFASPRNILDQTHVTALKTQLLTYMDGIVSRDKRIIFIGATNLISNVDSAVKRRMRLHIEIEKPDSQDILKLIEKSIKINSKEIAEQCEENDYSFSDVAELCKLAQLEAYARCSKKVQENDLTQAFKELNG
jgi:SpoVK/Ycf46/Vps4 family AAA+-type ATPase